MILESELKYTSSYCVSFDDLKFSKSYT